MAAGDYATRLPGSPVQELDDVSQAFNRMAEAVQTQLQALADGERYLRGLIDTMSEALVVVDRDLRMLDCNEAMARLAGVSREVFLTRGDALSEAVMVDAEGRELRQEERPVARAVKTGLPQRGALLRTRRPDGTTIWITMNATPLRREPDGAVYGAFATVSDVTRHVEAEQQLRGINERLEQRVRERTAELQQAKEAAEAANQAKERVPLRHEPRAAHATERDPRLRAAAVDDAGRRGTAAARAPDRVGRLAPARADQRRARPRPHRGRRDEHLAGAGGARRAGRQRDVDGAAAGRRARGDAGGTGRHRRRSLGAGRPPPVAPVMTNLLSNAVKYNHRGGSVQVAVGVDAAGQRTIAVRDTGRGFTPEQLAHLFEPFQRFVEPHEAIEGTGIGLVITRRWSS
ncbi:PAS domain S-box protein [Piscinibacter aquaticus]|uniref:histidine kinase n=1 Tax=Piscinibacter aquaticus TaxID=392597 RepID=A0A5C6U1K7_9BURK|nr:PAS domain S-box protein [Piscinibacter aquaticus]